MDVLILLMTATVVHGIPHKTCSRLKLGERYYERQTLWANLGRPYNLNLHKATNTLFFSYSVPEPYSDVDFQLAYFNLDTREFQPIPGILGGCAVAIDNANDIVYMGGSDGIYKFNMFTKIADVYKEIGQNIWSLFYNNNLFYISYPEQRLYLEIDGKFSIVKEFQHFEIDHFYVTRNNDIFFANKSGLYKYDEESLGVYVINELITVRQLMEDNEGHMYVCTNFGLFINEIDGLKKILDLKNIYGMAFDKDNELIISDENSIMKLYPSSDGCSVKDPRW